MISAVWHKATAHLALVLFSIILSITHVWTHVLMAFMVTLRSSNVKHAFLPALSAQVPQLASLALLASIFSEALASPIVPMATSMTIQLLILSAHFAQTIAQLVQESTPAHLVCLLVFSSVEFAALPVLQLPFTTSRTLVSIATMLFLAVWHATQQSQVQSAYFAILQQSFPVEIASIPKHKRMHCRIPWLLPPSFRFLLQ